MGVVGPGCSRLLWDCTNSAFLLLVPCGSCPPWRRPRLPPLAPPPRRIASPAPPAGGASAKLESELGEIKGLLAELLRSPSGSRTPRGTGDSASPRGSGLPAA